MKKVVLLAAVFATGLFAQGQGKGAPLTMLDDLKASYAGIKANLLEAADKMPEGNYSLHPGTQPRTFGGWVGHTADAQMGTCSGIAGAPKQLNAEKEKTSKADLIAALKESFDACDPIFAGTTDANAQEGVRSFRGTVPRVASLYGMIAHSNECYGSMAVYMRINELTPPSTQRGIDARAKQKQK